MKKGISYILAAVVVLAALTAGCSTTPGTVAVVNGVKITGEEYDRALNGFLSNYGLTQETLNSTMDLAEIAEYKNGVIDEMILQELMLQYAGDHGLDEVTEEDRQEIEEKVTAYLENLRDSFAADVQNEGTLQGEAAQKEAQERYDEYIEKYAYTRENLTEQFLRQRILDRVYDDVMQDCTIEENEIRAFYEEQLQLEEEAEQQDPEAQFSAYLAEVENADVVVYIPEKAEEETRYVKHILVQIPTETSAKISELEAAGDTEEAQAEREKAMTTLRNKALEILEEAEKGADFDTLIAKYNEDPGMTYNPDGYMVYEGASFDSAFLADALSLKEVGDISAEPVESEYGCHIIQFVSVPDAGPVPYADVRDEILETLNESKKEQYWSDAVASWEAAAMIEKHEFRSQ